MSEENSVAPIERVNLKYKSRAEGGQDVEIPLKLMVTGDFSFRENKTPLGERKPLDINKNNFDEVMESKKVNLVLTVDDHMSGVKDGAIQAKLQIRTLKDLTPDGIVAQVPEMKRQLDLARALQEVKADLANPEKLADLRRKIDEVLKQGETRKKLEEMKKIGEG
jgi:type VI secretion system protein ImpB